MITGHAAHLSEETINDVLIGLGSPEADAHLAACRECRERVAAFQADMRLFNATTLAWSEMRSATMTAPARARLRIRELMPVTWAAAVTMLLVLAVPIFWRHQPTTANRETPNAATAAREEQDTEAQIAEDNELMRSVDMALSASEESPLAEYHLASGPHPLQQPRPKLRKP